MKRNSILLLSLLLIVLILNYGCMGPQVNVANPVTPNLFIYQSVMIHASSQVEDSVEEIEYLEARIAQYLEKKTDFGRIVPYHIAPDSSTDLRINVKIVELLKASTGSAIIGAVLSPLLSKKAGIKVEVNLYDMKSGKSLGHFDVTYYKRGETTKGVIKVVSFQIAKTLNKDN